MRTVPKIEIGPTYSELLRLEQMDDDRVFHVYPLFGPEHRTTERAHCWCHPSVEFVEDGAIVKHNAIQ